MLGVGFEPTRLSPCDLKSHPLDHSGIPANKNKNTNKNKNKNKNTNKNKKRFVLGSNQ